MQSISCNRRRSHHQCRDDPRQYIRHPYHITRIHRKRTLRHRPPIDKTNQSPHISSPHMVGEVEHLIVEDELVDEVEEDKEDHHNKPYRTNNNSSSLLTQ